MWFASYLCQKGVITSDQFAHAVNVQMSCQRPLGTIAVHSRMLTIKQTLHILRENATHPERSFGQTAVELGYLTEDQLGVLLFRQSCETPALNEILVDLNFITREQMLENVRQSRLEPSGQGALDLAVAG